MNTDKSDDPNPTPPNITLADVLRQFWVDLQGKEVQSAATYSYMWEADELGHIGLGLILCPIVTFLIWGVTGIIAGKPVANPELIALIVVSAIFALWELNAYRTSANKTGDRFPLDSKMLRANAIVATAYMVIGAVAGYAFQVEWQLAVPLVVAMVALAAILAPRWIRQKIIWQKASLPYLFRLADARPTIDQSAAVEVQALIDAKVPPDSNANARQIIVIGPIGTGRTPLVTGIGTEFAFKARKVRYLTFAVMLEFAEQLQNQTGPQSFEFAEQLQNQTGPQSFPSVPGPKNISDGPWWKSQVLIFDDISPVVLDTVRSGTGESFEKILNRRLGNVAKELAIRHTVWVFGDDSDESEKLLEVLAKDIQKFCKSDQPPIRVRLTKI